jgi:hypothetical protein
MRAHWRGGMSEQDIPLNFYHIDHQVIGDLLWFSQVLSEYRLNNI